MRTSLGALWTNTISTISDIFQALCWRNAAHSCYGGLRVSGRLLRSTLGRQWGRWKFWGCGCRETTTVFFFSFSGLLRAPADSSICSVLLWRIGGKLASFKRWAVCQCNARSGWCFRLLLLVLCVQTDVHSRKSDMLNMHKLNTLCIVLFIMPFVYNKSLESNSVWLIICKVFISSNSIAWLAAN